MAEGLSTEQVEVELIEGSVTVEGLLTEQVEVELTEADIPGAILDEPLERHTMSALRWWLLCHGDCAPTSLKKLQLVERVRKARQSGAKVVDVDGSYMYRKQQSLIDNGQSVAPLGVPGIPLTGWKVVDKGNYAEVAKEIPCVTPGLIYAYLAEGSGNTSGRGAFRALQRGFNHWSCGRLSNIEVNTQNPSFCHVRCRMTPSMKTGVYNVTIVLGRDGELANIEAATCQCAAGKSASCTHVSGLLHALVSISESELQHRVLSKDQETDEEEEALPITSYACQWKIPKKRKEASLPFAEATFSKHVYGKEKQRTLKPLEHFDPRPDELKGTASSALPELLDKLHGKGLSISLSLDSKTRFWKKENTVDHSETELSPRLPSKGELEKLVIEFKQSLQLPLEKIRDIEQHTRNQSHSSLWYSVRRYRLTASYFGQIRQRRPTTSAHSLVLRILSTSSFSSPATEWGKDNEQRAIDQYVQQQQKDGKTDLYACSSGFVVSEDHPFLGASPDAVVYDPSVTSTFGLAEIKCPYSSRDMTPVEACSQPTFFCTLNSTSGKLQLKKEHPYHSQVQGQMAITKREWCDFVVYTEKGISIERIHFDKIFWEELLQKLVDFYDNCLAPEIVNPIHVLGMKVRDLRLM